MIDTDFKVPVGEIRAEFEQILGAFKLFNGKAKALEVTNLSAERVELRALVRASDSRQLVHLSRATSIPCFCTFVFAEIERH